MSIQPPDPWVFQNNYTEFPTTIGQLAQSAGIKAGHAIYLGHLAKGPVDEMVGTMSYAAESAANALRHTSGLSSIPRLPSYWESTTIPDVLNTKGFHLTDTEMRIPFNYDQVTLMKSGLGVFPIINTRMVISYDEDIKCLQNVTERMQSQTLTMSIENFENVLTHLNDPIVSCFRNAVPHTESSGDISTYMNMLVLKSAGVEYPHTISECKAIAVSIEALGKANSEFFGRITTTGLNDYFVAIAEGAFDLIVYCRQGFEGEWVELKGNQEPPLLMPIGLMNYPFSGRLESPVLSHPRFLGTEGDLLARLVKHIHSETWVYPMNLETRVPVSCIIPSVHCCESSKLSSFCRLPPHKSLDRDPSGFWTSKYIGDPNVYIDADDKDASMGIVSIHASDWPGAHFVLSGYIRRAVNIYVGNGMKHEEHCSFPMYPPLPVQSERENCINDGVS